MEPNRRKRRSVILVDGEPLEKFIIILLSTLESVSSSEFIVYFHCNGNGKYRIRFLCRRFDWNPILSIELVSPCIDDLSVSKSSHRIKCSSSLSG